MSEVTQKDLNVDMETIGLGRFRQRNESAKKRDAEIETGYGQRLMRASLPLFAKQVDSWLMELAGYKNSARYQMDVVELDSKLVAFVTVKAVLDSITKKKPLSSVAHFVGARIEDECRCSFLLRNNETKGGGILLGVKKRNGRAAKLRHLRSSMKNEAKKGLMDYWVAWSHRDKLNCGLNLVERLRTSTSLIEYVNLANGKRKKRSTRFVTATKETLEWIEQYNEYRELIEPFWLPTVELPEPWENVFKGGYNTRGTSLPTVPFIKTSNMEYLRGINGSLPEPMEATNLIQQTPWRVNGRVLEVMKHCWEHSVPIGDLPNREDEPLPPVPSDFETNEEANKLWKQSAARIYDRRVSQISRRLLVSKLLFIADKLKTSRFFYPSQVDFRGRIYNIPSFLGIQGPDMSRGLLTFSRPELINNDEDAFWLGVQGANTFGHDKVTLEERFSWAKDFSDTADRIASDPLGHIEYWREADSPWQFLAWCFEWAEYASTGRIKSHLPVNMDASNNGLQILSMLMRDEYGCHATNVTPTDTPSDIYSVVSDKVIERLKSDNATPIAHDWLSFGIDRKLAKRPTMVWPYGGTFYSCQAYVDDWFSDSLRKEGKISPFQDSVRHAATGYLSKHLWASINEVLIKPKECMKWLQEVAATLAKENKPISWVTPTGFPVLQSYKNSTSQNVSSNINGVATHVKWYTDADTISVRRQKQGISPNFVHSLDASCLTRSVLAANAEGIYDFSMIHDSYGTHSNKCHLFGSVLRNVFSEIFSKNLLDDFMMQVLTDNPRLEIPLPPISGDADITQVKDSKYFFC